MRPNALMILLALLLTSLAVGQTADKAASDKTIKDYMDLLRKDLRKDKSAVVDLAMGLDSGQKSKFYPIYEKYENELKQIWDKRLANIRKYAENYPNVSDAVADELVASAEASQAARSALLKKYYGQMKAALGSKIAARFLQVETSIANLIDLQLSSEIPLMP